MGLNAIVQSWSLPASIGHRSVTLIVHALPGDTWRVVVFGRAN